ncbi:hypothetical protein GCM10007939_12150 [Amylibacter marinus]|uniref:Tat (Twin-arginine translocation) pathway signal sequence n=1 Tax=Amylibacter marinus TaxID=1475483 RepID=A0ABQ5VU12_9RHOB|nr:DUF1501 domain-containing protein [Amylibacter marinus]GLQ34932.1 hypothetical protein GCM10007939_12150 [Amylibacter marinus]
MSSSRRRFLLNTMALGCSAAANPLITPVTYAATPSNNRLVVIILRGGMDGLDVVRPVGDQNFATYRTDMATGAHDLNGMFALHPALGDLMPMWRMGELGFAHAVSTPYRDKRSHFDGQDLLEAGYASIAQKQAATGTTGWLNRMLTLLPNVHAETAFAVGQDDLILLSGDAPHSSWSPGRSLPLSVQGQNFLERMYENDPLFHASAQTAITLSAETLGGEVAEGEDMMAQMADNLKAARNADRAQALARFTAEQMHQDTRIAAFSIGGWDTHRNQPNSMRNALQQLSTALRTLKTDLGPIWGKTAVLCMTEFGRTVRQNGTQGTDHGTGGALLYAGGAVRGKQVLGRWPGLADHQLYQQRDLMPTADVRGLAASAMQGLFGHSTSDLERVVFPNLDMTDAAKFIL